MVDYSAAIQSVDSSDRAASKSLSTDQSPDDAARSFELSRASGVPAQDINQDIPGFEQAHKAQLGKMLIDNNPDVSNFINAHPLHGQLIHDDLGSLDEYSRAYRRIAPGGHPLTEAAKGFAEGFGNVGEIGQEYPRFVRDADKYPTATALLAPVGIPLEVAGRTFRGVTAGAYRAVKALGINAGMGEQDADKQAKELAGILEYELMKPSSRMIAEPAAMRPRVAEEILPPEPKPAAPGGLPKPPPTIEGELTGGPTDLSRRGFLQGAAAIAASRAVPKLPETIAQLAKAPLSRLEDPMLPHTLARQALYKLGEDTEQAIGYLLDEAADTTKLKPVFTKAAEMIRSGQIMRSGIGESLQQTIQELAQQEAQRLRPYLEAGERPPSGVSDLVDEIEAQHTELSSKATDEVIAARDKTALSQRSPEKLEEFTQGLPKGTTRIAVDAFAKVPPEKFNWIPDLEQKLASGATSITVPTNTYISKIEKEIHDEIKEFVSHGEDLSPAEVKELKENKVPPESIKSAALMHPETGKVYEGTTHATAIEEAAKDFPGYDVYNQYLREGFTTDRGRFVGREEAQRIAESQKQITERGAERQASRRKAGVDSSLIAEDLALQTIRDGAGFNPQEFAQKMLPAEGGPPGKPPEEPPSPPEGGPLPEKPKRIFSKAKAFGRTEREYSAYEKLIAQRDAEDVEWRLKRAQKQAALENSKAWKDEASSIRAEVRDEISSRPEIAAYRFFQDGEAYGNKLARRPKINEASLTPEQKASFPKQFIAPRGRGYDPDAVANLFGLGDGDSVVAAISALEREATAGRGDIVDRLVDAEVNRRVDAKLGETAKERLDEAYDHALSVTQIELIHERMLQLGTQVGTAIEIPPVATKLGALNLLHQELFGGMSSRRFLNDAGRFGRRVDKALLSDDPAEAFKSAQAQYIAAEMAKEAKQVEKETKVFDRLEKRYRKREVDGRDPAYTNWIHDILNQIGEGRRDPNDIRTEIEAAPEKTLQEFIDARAAMGRAIYMPQFLLDRQAKNLDEMNVLEARQVMNALRSLDKSSRDETQVVTATGKIDLKNLQDQMAEKLETLGVATEIENLPGLWGGFRKTLRWYNAESLQIESILNRWDRGDAFGIFNQWIGRPLIEAANYESQLQKEIAKDYKGLPNQLTWGELNRTVPNTIFRSPRDAWKSAEGKYDFSDAEPIPFTRAHLRSVLLNAGNESNLKKLADGYQIKPEQIKDWLDTYAKKEDWDWAQAHGKMFEKLKKLSDIMRRDMYGVAPEKVELQPIQTPHGEYEGWYHPVIYSDIWKGQRVAASKPSDLFVGNNPWSRPSTPAAYTYERTGYVAPINLNFDQIPAKLSQEIHDIAFHQPVVNAAKIIMDPKNRFVNTVSKHYGKAYADLFEPWLRDIANARNYNGANQEMGEYIRNYTRAGWVQWAIGLNLGTIEKHTPTALMNSISEVGGREFADAAGSLLNEGPVRGEKNWDWAIRTFDELQRRHQNWMENVSGAQEASLAPMGFEAARQKVARISTWPVAFLDLASAVPTAIAAYKTALDEGRSFGDAVYAGNRAVRRAHGSTAITSRSAFQRDYPEITYLYNFMSRMYQYGYEYSWKAKDIATGQAGSKAPEYARNIIFGYFATVMFMGMVETAVSDTDPDETWESFAGKSLVNGMTAPLIGVRQLVHAIMHKSDPVMGLGGEEMKRLTDLVRDIKTKGYGMSPDRAGRTIKHANDLFGFLTGLSNAEIGNMQEYLYDLDHGKAKVGDWWRGLRRGKTDKPTSEENFLKLLRGGKR